MGGPAISDELVYKYPNLDQTTLSNRFYSKSALMLGVGLILGVATGIGISIVASFCYIRRNRR